MRKCKYAQKYHHLTRCMKDGSLRHCNPDKCRKFRPTLLCKLYEWWGNL